MGYRFRVDEGRLVLQVQEASAGYYNYGAEREAKWRDAKVEDIPVLDPFGSQGPWPPIVERAP